MSDTDKRKSYGMKYKDFTHSIIGSAIEVHKILGPGLLESAYEECLEYELIRKGYKTFRQMSIPVKYKQIQLDCGYRIDLLVENKVIIDLKLIKSIKSIHVAQILTYMKFANKNVGLLIRLS